MVRVAFVHDWLVTYRGGEKVLASMLKLFPDAPIYTLYYDPTRMPEVIKSRRIITAPSLRGLNKLRKALLPLYPRIIEMFDFSDYDLIISSSSCVAKGVKHPPQTKHLCYIHSPMRYIWDQQHIYLAPFQQVPVVGALANYCASRLRVWDRKSSSRVDRFVANSTFVQQRVKKYYDRDADVVFPPIQRPPFKGDQYHFPGDDFFLVAGAMVAYKRFDLAIEACRKAKRKLIVAGSGPEEPNLRRLAAYSDVDIIVEPDDRRLAQLLTEAKALLFPGVEDFGMIAIEAMACGTPVIAFAEGGARDFVTPGKTGEFFAVADANSLAAVLKNFDKTKYDRKYLRRFAAEFNEEHFLNNIRKQVNLVLERKVFPTA